ncbi:hypothetical protein J5N97_018176 [Dioscorea zingiberensis]|uniref:BIRD-IDD transcription factor fourth C2HC zinc finger domain-containing protein n=1 Tax=Dioscorea zingiberensis TaxID=325984 RepID=A0A9D5CMQ9_9LILI|nr:hypothetical protein J5N97_018176 [Dioscorea zingiberensis]
MIQVEPLEISQASRSTSSGNMVKRSGSVRSAQKSMQCNQTGRLTPRLVALESTNVTVAPSSPGFPHSFRILLIPYPINEVECDMLLIIHRRDSFITHRAFCDALAEENRASQCLRASITAGFKGQSPQLMMPISGNTANNRSSMGMADFGHDMKNHLKALCQEFIPMPIKAMRMTDGGMFSSNSGPVFGACSVSSASAFLQLGGNNATVFDGPGGSSAHTSATVLLQKAAQMGATSSGSLHSPMMQQGFVTNMGSFGSMQAPGPYEQIQQSQMVSIDRQGTVLDTAPTGVFISSGNEGHAMLKNVEHESSGGMTKFMQRNGSAGLMAMAGRFGGGDTTEQQ